MISTHAIPSGIATPPLAGAQQVVARLQNAGITLALGGSGLLAALGLATSVHDWDLTTDAPREQVERAIEGLAWDYKGSDELHADEKLMIPSLELEIIRGFAFFTPLGVVRIPTLVSREWAGLPVGAPECWAVAYHLLDRAPKCEALFEWLAQHGAAPLAIEALMAQPLPAALASRLASLPFGRD